MPTIPPCAGIFFGVKRMSVTPRRPLAVQPHPYIGDVVGRPLDRGMIYFGEPDKDPQDYPITVYLDPEQTKPAHQPIRTKGGFINVFGDITEIFADEILYSLKVLDCYGRLVFYKKRMHRDNITEELGGEIVRAQKAESALQSSIDAEAIRAKAAESDLNTGLAKEVSDRESEVVRLDEADAVLQAQINSVGGGKLAYKTYAEMIADKSNIAAKSSIDVIADTDDKNGTYLYDGANFVKSQYDIEKIIRAKVQNTFGTYAQMVASNLSDGAYALVADDTVDKNGIYIKEGGAWVKSSYDPLKQAKSYADNVSWTAFDRKYTKPSTNLFNPKNALIGYSLHSSTGKEIANPDYISTDRIYVNSGQEYRVVGNFTAMFIYAEDGSFIRRDTPTSSFFIDSVATMPSGASYIRFSILSKDANEDSLDKLTLMVSKGSEPVPYSKGYPVLDGIHLDGVQGSLDREAIVPDIKSLSKLTREGVIEYNNNLYRADSSIIFKRIEADGTEVDVDDWYHTDFIPVEPDEVYTMSGVAGSYAFEHIAYYDIDKKFIQRVNSRTKSSESGEIEVVTPSNAYYAILNFQISYPTEDERMFYKGVKGKKYSKPRLSRQAKKAIYDSFSSDYLKSGINLISSDLVEGGFSLSPTSGAKRPSSVYGIVNFVPVEPDTLYTAKGGRITVVYYYDSNKLYIGRDVLAGKGEFTTPTDTAFVRFLIANPSGGEVSSGQFLGKGSFDKDYYAVGHKQLTNLRLDNENIEDISARLDPLPFILSNSPTSVYNNTADLSGYLKWKSNTPEQVYAMFDSLAQSNPNYITKQNLGVTSEGRELSVYKVSPARPSGASDTKPHYPKVLIVGGIHGYEKLPALTLYLMLEQLCNNYSSSDMLELLRLNVEFVILPLANPDGWARNSRKNANAVDLNRNFPSGFTPPTVAPDHEKYGGEVALQEVEAQLIHQLVQDNLDSNIGIDFHNFFGADGTPIWLSTRYSTKMQALAKAHITRMSHKWRKDFDWFPDDLDYFAGYTTSGVGGGILSRHMHDSGITNSLTYEFSESWGGVAEGVTPYDEVSVKTALESFVNFILMALHALENNKLH